MSQSQILPASTGTAIPLKTNQTIKITNTHGAQVVDFWALSDSSPGEYLSIPHTHAILRKLTPSVGDTLFSCTSQPMLSFVEDTTKGAHDTLIAACNPRRYEKMGVQGWHASCEENYRKSVAKLSGVEGAPKTAPAPLNLFMNVGVKGDGKIVFEKPSSQQGESVTFKALMGLVIVMSACPMDQKASEDWWPQPREVDWEIVG